MHITTSWCRQHRQRRFTAPCMQAEQKMKAGASSQQVDADLRARAQLETSRPLITPNMVQLPAQRTPGNTEQAIGADGVPLSGAVSAFPNVQHIYSNELAMTSAAEDASLAEWAPQPSQMQSATAAEQVRWGYRR